MAVQHNPKSLRLKTTKKRILIAFLIILGVGLLIPQQFSMPVEGADNKSYNSETFWHYPWGKSVTHKGVDVFAKEGTPIHSSTPGMVVASGELSRGGKYVLVLGAKWRLHYYAHLKDIHAQSFTWVNKNKSIGTVGKTGNAATTPAHLHYSIVTLIPYPWRIDKSPQGWKKMFYLNPINYLNQ